MDIHQVQRRNWICYLTLDKHIQDGYGDQLPLYMILSNTNQ
jgi:hypothetical protein